MQCYVPAMFETDNKGILFIIYRFICILFFFKFTNLLINSLIHLFIIIFIYIPCIYVTSVCTFSLQWNLALRSPH